MRSVGVREFRDQATSMMSSGETLVIERHGEPIGFFVPISANDRGRVATLWAGLAGGRRRADTHGVNEDDLVARCPAAVDTLMRLVVDTSVLVGELLRQWGANGLATTGSSCSFPSACGTKLVELPRRIGRSPADVVSTEVRDDSSPPASRPSRPTS